MIELKLHKPNYFLMPINDSLLSEYALGFSLADIFKVRGHAILTKSDELLINTKLDKLKTNIDEYMCGESNIEVGEFTKSKGVDLNGVYKVLPYRVFDNRYYYDSKLTSARCLNLTKHESIENNYYLGFTASVIENCNYSHTIITKFTPDVNFFKGKGKLHSAPLYIKENSND